MAHRSDLEGTLVVVNLGYDVALAGNVDALAICLVLARLVAAEDLGDEGHLGGLHLQAWSHR